MSRSAWREQRNAEARTRLAAATPPTFPAPVTIHALARALVPPLPRLAVESYWRAHPLRADRLARALAAQGGAPEGWRWRLSETAADGRARSFRAPPAPYREAAFHRGPGHCCVCGQPVYRFGWHRDLWNDGRPNRRAAWHACCVAAWKLWTAPTGQAALLRRAQGRRCALTGARLLRDAEIDHRVALESVWRQHRDTPWPRLLDFWGAPNLQAINRPAHAAKTAGEATARARLRADPGRESAARGSHPVVLPQMSVV